MGKNKYKGIKSYAQDNVTAPRKIVRGGKVEELSYINKEAAKLLKSLGASGEATPYGGINSYYQNDEHIPNIHTSNPEDEKKSGATG